MEMERDFPIVVISAGISAIPIVGGPLQTFFDEYTHAMTGRAELTAAEIAEKVGGANKLLDRVHEVPELGHLLARTLETAYYATFEAKRRLLVQAAAAAFDHDERIDSSILTVLALSELEPVHIRAMAELETSAPRSAFGQPAPVAARLIRAGVVDPTTSWSGGQMVVDLNDFGRELLRSLRESDPTDPTAHAQGGGGSGSGVE